METGLGCEAIDFAAGAGDEPEGRQFPFAGRHTGLAPVPEGRFDNSPPFQWRVGEGPPTFFLFLIPPSRKGRRDEPATCGAALAAHHVTLLSPRLSGTGNYF